MAKGGAKGIRAGRAFVELGVSDKLTRGLKRAQARLKAFSAGVKRIGQGVVAASAAAAVPLAAATAVFATFEQRMARVRALTGATGKDFKRLSDVAQRLGQTTVFSASQAADAMSFFALAGFQVRDILKAIGPTLDLAAAGQLDVAQAADIATKIMSGMGIEADNLAGAVDLLTKAMTTANTDLGQLGDAMKFIGPIARSAGIQLEDIVAAVQLLSNAGIQGEMAGTTLRSTLLALVSPSEQARKELKKLGVSVADAAGNVRPLTDVISDFDAALGGLGTAQRLDILGRIFPNRAAGGVATLLEQGAPKLREFADALRGSAGTAARIASVQLNTLKGTATILKSALEGLGIAIGDALVGPLRVAIAAITKVVKVAIRWAQVNKVTVTIVAAAVVGVGALGAGLVAVGVAAQVAAFVFGGLATIVSAVVGVFGTAAAAIGALVSPIGLVVAAIAGLGTAIVVYTGAGGKAINWLGDQFGQFQGFVSDVLAGIRDALAAGDLELAAQVLWAGLKVVWEKGVAALDKAWLKAKQFFVSTAQKMWFGAQAAAQRVFHALEVAWIETTSFLSKTWTNFTSDLKQAWGLTQNWLTKRWLDLMNLFGQLTDAQAKAAKEMANQDFADSVGEIERKRSAALKAAEDRRKAQRDQAAAVNEATLAEIGKSFEKAQAALNNETATKVAAAEAQLRDAVDLLNQAIASAKTERERRALERLKRKFAKTFGGPQLPGDGDIAAGLANAVASKLSVVGTFNPAGLRGLGIMGAGNVFERIAKSSEETARNTRKANKKKPPQFGKG